MHHMASQAEEQFAHLVASIKQQRYILDEESKRLRTPAILNAFDRRNHDSWCLAVAGDSLVRLRLLTEQNFNFIETMGVIAVARYVFELSVWLHLFELDARYGLVYYSQLLDTQRRYWRDYRDQLRREIAFLQQLEKKESDALRQAMSQIKNLADPEEQEQALLTVPNAISASTDDEAARHFSIYAEQAKVNGYGFQAYLVERKAVPQVEASLAGIDSETAAFYAQIPKDMKNMIPRRWEWRQMAQRVGLTDEYDFIYTFSSKLLHATPASITTDEKNLELPEFVLFLRYIYVKIMDMIEMARKYPK